ncbi:MAG: hypothetical protein VB962_13295 [Pseudohongiellaceae bacterium]
MPVSRLLRVSTGRSQHRLGSYRRYGSAWRRSPGGGDALSEARAYATIATSNERYLPPSGRIVRESSPP